jgi:hypothetical protein
VVCAVVDQQRSRFKGVSFADYGDNARASPDVHSATLNQSCAGAKTSGGPKITPSPDGGRHHHAHNNCGPDDGVPLEKSSRHVRPCIGIH